MQRIADRSRDWLSRPSDFPAVLLVAAVALHKLTRTTPIVMPGGSGPVQAGIARSLAPPQSAPIRGIG